MPIRFCLTSDDIEIVRAKKQYISKKRSWKEPAVCDVFYVMNKHTNQIHKFPTKHPIINKNTVIYHINNKELKITPKMHIGVYDNSVMKRTDISHRLLSYIQTDVDMIE